MYYDLSDLQCGVAESVELIRTGTALTTRIISRWIVDSGITRPKKQLVRRRG